MLIRAVLFDLDGTLVDSNRYHVEAWHRVFAATGRVQTRAAIATQIGKGADNLVPALIPDADDALAEQLGTLHGQFFKADYLPRVRPFPGAHDLVKRVHDSGRQAVLASSASQGELDHYIKLLGIDRFVDQTTAKDDVETTKPAPDIFAVALKRADVSAEEAVVIGDAPYDMEAARKLGTGRIAVCSGGFDDAALTAAGAEAIYADVAAILSVFDTSPLTR